MTRPSILTRLKLWNRRTRTRGHLRDLPDHLLRDIGIDDAARARECARWFWQGVPTGTRRQKKTGAACARPSAISR
ncbi:DUF1127 domain-containing protein [Undibacter mobilis]|nr:DUF1127 domain-containing protein [Undibacter mobilis]